MPDLVEPPDESADATTPAAEPKPRRRRRPVLRVILITHLVLAILTAAAVTFGYHSLNGNIITIPGVPPDVKRPDEVASSGPRKPLNILVLGLDTRTGEGNEVDGATASEGSDTAILMHISKDRKDVYGVSLPRDALVTRPDCVTADGDTVPGQELAMFNTAFAVGGATCAIQTVESLTDVRIHHTVVVDFNGFVGMVDSIGGVEVCIPKDVDDPEHGISFDAGTQVLDGTKSLDYVRERFKLSVTGDIGRMKRQQAFLASMISKVASAGTLSRPDRLYGFLDEATQSVMLDEGLNSIAELTDLAGQLRGTGLDDIKFITVPFAAYEPDPNRLVWTEEANELWERIRNDQPLGKDFSEGSISPQAPTDEEREEPVSRSAERASGASVSTVASTVQQDDAEQREEEALRNGLCP